MDSGEQTASPSTSSVARIENLPALFPLSPLALLSFHTPQRVENLPAPSGDITPQTLSKLPEPLKAALGILLAAIFSQSFSLLQDSLTPSRPHARCSHTVHRPFGS